MPVMLRPCEVASSRARHRVLIIVPNSKTADEAGPRPVRFAWCWEPHAVRGVSSALTGPGCPEHDLARFAAGHSLLTCARRFTQGQELPTPAAGAAPSGSDNVSHQPLLPDAHAESCRQSVLSISRLRICINGIFDAKLGAAPRLLSAPSIFHTSLWRAITILIMSQRAGQAAS